MNHETRSVTPPSFVKNRHLARKLTKLISKRRDRYLRTLLIHGAWATVHRARRKSDARSRWIVSLEQRRGKNIATVAIADKNARIAWALLTSDAEYRKAA